MNPNQLIDMTRSIGKLPSRRDVLRGLTGAGLGLGPSWLPDIVDAKKKRKRKHKRKKKGTPATPNEFGCFEVGDPCQSEADCCSGICEGKKCRAHDTGTCPQSGTGVCLAPTQEAGHRMKCNGAFFCFCHLTTAGSYFCATPTSTMPEQCADCKTDADCAVLGFPAGSACAPVREGHCSGSCASTNGMACLVPCGTEFPELAE